MKARKRKRSPELRFVVSAEQYTFIRAQWSTSCSRSVNDYARTILLKKPALVKMRNQSAEDLLAAMIPIKNELETFGKNFAAAVKRLQDLGSLPEIKNWCADPGHSPEKMFDRIEEIRRLMYQYYSRCTQPSI